MESLSCDPEPAAPGQDATDNEDSSFILSLAYAGRDCRKQLTEELPALLKAQGVMILERQLEVASPPPQKTDKDDNL